MPVASSFLMCFHCGCSASHCHSLRVAALLMAQYNVAIIIRDQLSAITGYFKECQGTGVYNGRNTSDDVQDTNIYISGVQ